MEFSSDIIISGGGLNGAALALVLASVGLSSVVVDAQPAAAQTGDNFDGRGYALALTSQRLLRAIGIWDSIAAHAEPMLEIKVSDGRAGQGPAPFVLEFDHAEIEEGPMGFMIEDRYLRRALQQGLGSDPLIDHIAATSVVAHSARPGGVNVALSSGQKLRAKLLIGCDGRASPTAKRAAIKRTGWDYGQMALVCAVAHERPHNGIAHQFFMPSGPLAILPLPGKRSSIVWTENSDEAARIQKLSDADYLSCLRPRFGDFLGAIELAGARFSYPLELTLANSFIAERTALVGDAAHAVHPIAGQGLNAGLKDIAALGEVLALAHRRGEDIGQADVLARYQQWRRFDVATLAAATDAFNRLFSNDNTLLRLGRDMGLAAVNAVPGLRRGLIREAAGLTGDLPKLLQGRAI